MEHKILSSILDSGQFTGGESERQDTLNDLLTLPDITIPFDDNICKLCEEIEALHHEDLFRKISEITKIQNYPFDLRAYWLIDIIAGFLIDGKRKGLSSENLWATLSWFNLIFNGFKENKWTHESLMQHIQSVTLASAQEVKMRDQRRSFNDSPLKTIAAISKDASMQNIPSKSKQKKAKKKMGSISSIETLTQYSKGNKKHRSTKVNSISKPEVMYTLEDLLIITNIFYDLFAKPFQFKLLQWALLDLDQVIILEFPYPINIARDLKVSPSPVPSELTKSASQGDLNLKKNNKRKKKKGQSPVGKSNELTLQQMDEMSKPRDRKSKKKSELQSEDEKRKGEQEFQNEDEIPKPEEVVQENWEVDDNIYILPLQDANGIGKDFFLQLFPQTEDESKGNKIKVPRKKEGKKNKKGK